ncbi:hypothetical protein V5N11_004508 [Cardamine amara subsp. amara]|uniref:Zinc knuckle CX2CX4HX4C domain-containing protein n=1 Tax=Cardamine amara subsp. amara TaxID=228776 RepID=A0ABD1C3G2_CARAN
MIMERWIPSPPADFLTSFDVWVRIRNISFNHFTLETMNTLGSSIRKVEEITYDPEVSQITDFVRVHVNMKIANHARSTKNLNIPSDEMVVIQYEYEKLWKHCFHCIRFTHEKTLYLLLCKSYGLMS